MPTLIAAHPMPTVGDAPYREILDSAVDTAVISTDRQGRILTWSAGAQHITGWSAEEMVVDALSRKLRDMLEETVEPASTNG